MRAEMSTGYKPKPIDHSLADWRKIEGMERFRVPFALKMLAALTEEGRPDFLPIDSEAEAKRAGSANPMPIAAFRMDKLHAETGGLGGMTEEERERAVEKYTEYRMPDGTVVSEEFAAKYSIGLVTKVQAALGVKIFDGVETPCYATDEGRRVCDKLDEAMAARQTRWRAEKAQKRERKAALARQRAEQRDREAAEARLRGADELQLMQQMHDAREAAERAEARAEELRRHVQVAEARQEREVQAPAPHAARREPQRSGKAAKKAEREQRRRNDHKTTATAARLEHLVHTSDEWTKIRRNTAEARKQLQSVEAEARRKRAAEAFCQKLAADRSAAEEARKRPERPEELTVFAKMGGDAALRCTR